MCPRLFFGLKWLAGLAVTYSSELSAHEKKMVVQWDEKLQPNLMWPCLEFLLKLLLLLFFYIDLNIEESLKLLKRLYDITWLGSVYAK
jgi:hypothetical protein